MDEIILILSIIAVVVVVLVITSGISQNRVIGRIVSAFALFFRPAGLFWICFPFDVGFIFLSFYSLS